MSIKKFVVSASLLAGMILAVSAVSVAAETEEWDCGATEGTVTCVLTDDGTLTVSGSGAMKGYDPMPASGGPTTPWHQAHKNSDGYSTNPIKQVIIADGVTTVGRYAFAHCVNLESVTIPASVTVIGERAFHDCKVLTLVTSKNPVPPTLQADVFNDISLTAELLVPNANVDVYAENQDWIQWFGAIGYITVIDVWDCGATAGTVACTLFIDGTLTVSGSGAMRNYDPVEGSGGPTTPWHQAHKNSDGYSTNPIKQVIIADGVTTIGHYAFAHCVNMTSVTIPASVAVIGKNAFYRCNVLASVTSNNPVPPTLQADVFKEIRSSAELLVPDTKVEAYAATGWGSAFAYIYDEVGTSGMWHCGAASNDGGESSVKCILAEDGTLTVSGSGAMRNYDPVEGSGGPTTPWHQAHKNSDGYSTNPIKKVVIADGVTTIGHYAFAHCVNMTSVTIPASVAVIGKNAFYRCNVLASVTSNNPVPPTLQADVFLEINEDAVLKVPSASVETYKADEGWNSAFNNSIVADGPSSIGNAVRAAQSVATGPRATVRNRTLVVRASTPTATARVRLIDMRGKSVASFTAKGNGNFALTKIPAGRYFVEVREGAKRERGSVVIGVR